MVEAVRGKVRDLPADVISRPLVRRTTLTRQWRLFLDEYAVLLLPVSSELPFPDDLDRQGQDGFDRVWEAQLTLRALPAMGLPGLAVTTALVNGVPVGVQVVAAHHREDLCLLAGRDIEGAACRSRRLTPWCDALKRECIGDAASGVVSMHSASRQDVTRCPCMRARACRPFRFHCNAPHAALIVCREPFQNPSMRDIERSPCFPSCSPMNPP